MSTLIFEIRYALRLLRKTPGFTAIAVATLALGIGANTVVFTAIESFLLRPLPLKEPSKLVFVEQANTRSGSNLPASYPDFLEWKASAAELESLSAVQIDTFNLTGSGEPRRLRGSRVSGEFFHVMGLPPQLGRAFGNQEDRSGAPPVAVISYRLWSREFGTARDVLGRGLTLDGKPYTIIGVMPAALTFPGDFCDFWVPLAASGKTQRRDTHSLYVVGRLRPGASIAQLRSRLETLAVRLAAAYPDSNRDLGIRVSPFHERLTKGPRPALLILFAAVTFVLLICCANIANLLLARATRRQGEIAIRMAVGAGRRQLLRQLLVESVLLAAIGGLAGVQLAFWGVDGLSSVIGPGMLPMGGLAIDTQVLQFSAGLSLLTGILFGLAPALRLLSPDVIESLREAGRCGPVGLGRNRTAGALVIGEVGIAALLLIGSGMLVDALRRMQSADLGFNPHGVLTAEFAANSDRYRDPEQAARLLDDLVKRLNAAPGVTAAAAVNWLPMTNNTARSFAIEGRQQPGLGAPSAGFRVATPRYAEAVGIRLARGRFFNEADRPGAPPVVVVNERFAATCWPGEEALGKRIALSEGSSRFGPWATVVGVVGDIRHDGPTAPLVPEFFFPLAQQPQASVYLAIRTAGDPGAFTRVLRSTVNDLDATLPLNLVRTMDRVISDRMAATRVTTVLLAFLGTVALLLAAMGLYGVMSYLVGGRRQEFGVRVALGASPSSLLRLVLRRAMLLTSVGIALGALGGVAAARVLASAFEGIRPDPLVFLGAVVALSGVAFLAAWVPLARLLASGPLNALREL